MVQGPKLRSSSHTSPILYTVIHRREFFVCFLFPLPVWLFDKGRLLQPLWQLSEWLTTLSQQKSAKSGISRSPERQEIINSTYCYILRCILESMLHFSRQGLKEFDAQHLLRNTLTQRKQKYKEAQAAPLPLPIGGIDVKCGSCALDYPSAIPSPPPPFF